MQYSILKDDKTENTVKKIKEILQDSLSLQLNEKEFIGASLNNKGLYSVRVTIPDRYDIGTNGKGTSLINAQASGYAEFMERIQNLHLMPVLSDSYTRCPDEKIYNLEQLYNSEIGKLISPSLLKLCNKLVNRELKYNLRDDEVVMAPFYSVNKKEEVYFPILIFQDLFCGSNGMASGNTFEEAIVQGLSEICERYAFSQIISNELTMPEIPKNEYEEYENITEVIEYLKKAGYEINIKDASAGKKLPVVCVLFKDTENNILYMKYGAQPSLPIAIERCLTEFAQGLNNINDRLKLKKSISKVSKEYYRNAVLQDKIYLIDKMSSSNHAIDIDEQIEQQYYTNKPSYTFTKSTWFSCDKNTTNKQLLDFMVNNILEITKQDIYIRNVSFLGFPSVYIFVPGMSFFIIPDEKMIKARFDSLLWYNYDTNNQSDEYTVETLLNALEYGINMAGPSDIRLTSKLDEYLAMLCSICLNDYNRIKLYSKFVLKLDEENPFMKEKGRIRLRFIYDLYDLKSKNHTESDIIEKLKEKYSQEDLDDGLLFINNNSFNRIKGILKIQKLEAKKYPAELCRKISMLYEQNVPSQLILKDLL